MKKKIYFEFLYLFTLGALTSLSLPPYNLFFVNFFTLSLFLIFILKKKLSNNKKPFFYGWLFGFGYFLISLHWISISLTFDNNYKYLIPLSLILIPSFLAIFYGFVTYFLFLANFKNVLTNLFLFSILTGILEFIRGTILTGFPWNLISYSLSNNLEIIQITSVIGIYAFNTLCISFFSIPAIFFLKKSKKEVVVSILIILSPIILFIYGSSKIKSFQLSDPIKNEYVIRAIGSNIDINRFYEHIDVPSVINELIKISKPDLNTKTFFIWPEGIIPYTDQLELKNYKFLFDDSFNDNHLIGLGINSFKNINNENIFYNSFSIYDFEVNLINDYYKVNLVPFGEFLPFEKVLSKIGLKSLTNNYQSYSSGVKRNIIDINQKEFDLKLLPLICYEIIYSGKIFDNSNFDYIINISEDGWFGDSIGPHQHFAHSIFRAVESGKYLIRSSNNGITAIVNPTGGIEKEIGLGNSGYIDLIEKKVIDKTLFSQHGNKMFVITILLYIFLIFSFNRFS
ncbi:apolipoprotein N-acyltransferase [Candidatus Pelagibacter sp.]|nr:apolipoprotein N-acyltransferase [Candidatus Pelagibacter sp.]